MIEFKMNKKEEQVSRKKDIKKISNNLERKKENAVHELITETNKQREIIIDDVRCNLYIIIKTFKFQKLLFPSIE